MKCPNCNETLVMSDRQGVEIDYCPKCRGVWLDRGELDKIIERSAAYDQGNTNSNTNPNPTPPPSQYKTYPDHKYGNQQYDSNYKKKKRGGFLDDIFDF